MRSKIVMAVSGILVSGLLMYCGKQPTQVEIPPETVLAAGDIASCGLPYTEETATLVAAMTGTVLTLGDAAYPHGTAADYAGCYDSTWGRFKSRTRPVPGNHDYYQGDSSGYFNYFGAAAGDPKKGYYSYDLGAWHILALNTNYVEFTYALRDLQAPELQWIVADLAAHRSRCILAYFHEPRFSSGTTHGSDTLLQPLWQLLADQGVDVVLTGHEHNYERFAPQQGVREFVAGTGGGGSYALGDPIPYSEISARVHGILKLTLRDGSYSWQFVPVADDQWFTDSGTTACRSK